MMRSDQQERYERHLMLEEIGLSGQEKIINSKVLIIGAGGLGSPIVLYLAAAGVGCIGIADGDTVQLSNLQRQIIHFTEDLDKTKPNSAFEKISKLNPHVKVNLYNEYLDEISLSNIIKKYDIVVDATDNFKSKFMINDICIKENRILSHGGVLKFSGQTMTIIPKVTACFRCVFGEIPIDSERYSKAGILGSVAGMLGTIQATEVLKIILDIEGTLKNRLLSFDAKEMTFRTVNIKKDPCCFVCAD